MNCLKLHVSLFTKGKDLLNVNCVTSNRHASSIHEREKPFKCEICKKSFALNRNMRNCVARIHEGGNANFVTLYLF